MEDQGQVMREAMGAVRPSRPWGQAEESSRPNKEEAAVTLGYQPEVPEDVEDIDPRQWLEHDDSLIVDRVKTRAGYIKIAALNESEQDDCRRLSEKFKYPGKPSAGREVRLKLLRLWIVAKSLNKAYGYSGPDELTAEKIERSGKLFGEITLLVNRITEISGFESEDTEQASSFLSIR